MVPGMRSDEDLSELCYDAACWLFERFPAMTKLGYVVSVMFDADDLAEATIRARQIVQMLDGLVPGLEPESTTIAPEGARSAMRSVICGLRLDGDKRCLRLYGHGGIHAPLWTVA